MGVAFLLTALLGVSLIRSGDAVDFSMAIFSDFKSKFSSSSYSKTSVSFYETLISSYLTSSSSSIFGLRFSSSMRSMSITLRLSRKNASISRSKKS